MKTYILGVVIVVSLFGCESKEKVALQHKVDSLNFELVTIKEVGLLIDSIDESRKFLQVKIMEGDNYANHVSRLQEINRYIQKSEVKLKPLEEFNKNPSKVSASTITQLKADLEN
ncbi:MAG: hypothetical protein JNM78_05095 [Cyclobacteriaceae bacterium]|nr:hypothetical protein [Cyclobacteriaceae bacterium]